MHQHMLGKTGFRVSAITLGGGGIGMVWGPTTDEEGIETVKQAVASGINLIDVAPVYGKGKSEEIVGQAWRALTPKPLIATKVFVMPDERKDLSGAVRRSVEGSLKRLGLGQIDVFQLHNQIEPQEPTSPRRAHPAGGCRPRRRSGSNAEAQRRGSSQSPGMHGDCPARCCA